MKGKVYRGFADSCRTPGPVEVIREELRLGRLSTDIGAIVGYSGGPDSTALLAALVAAGFRNLRAVHVDHGLRSEPERNAELATVRKLASSLGVPLIAARVRPGAIAELAGRRGEGIEAAARCYRYAALRGAARRAGASAIYLAHTRDDQLETILMRFLSGSGAAGLRGMRRESGMVIRPFLELPKASLLEYLAREGLPYFVDSTNEGDAYARNRLRHHVVPALSAFSPGWAKGVALSARKAAFDEEALGSEAASAAFRRAGRIFIADLTLLSKPDAIRLRAFLATAGELSRGRKVPFRLATAALAALDGGATSYRGGGFEIRRREAGLELSLALDFPGGGGYFVKVDDPGQEGFHVSVGDLSVSAAWQRGGEAFGIRRDAFSFPLVIRSRRPGDALAIRGGRKLLDVLFSEWGVEGTARDRIPVIEDRDGILAVLGAGSGGRDRYRQNEGCGSDIRLSIQVKGA